MHTCVLYFATLSSSPQGFETHCDLVVDATLRTFRWQRQQGEQAADFIFVRRPVFQQCVSVFSEMAVFSPVPRETSFSVHIYAAGTAENTVCAFADNTFLCTVSPPYQRLSCSLRCQATVFSFHELSQSHPCVLRLPRII